MPKQTYPRRCPRCGKEWNATRASAIYCTPTCRTLASKLRSTGNAWAAADQAAVKALQRANFLRAVADRLKPQPDAAP